MNTIYDLQVIQSELDLLILSTPTSENRNKLTELNIKIIILIDRLTLNQ